MDKQASARGGSTTQRRYGSDFVAGRARSGLVAQELAKVAHPERLTPDEIEAVYRQVMRRQAATMRAAKAAKRVANVAANGQNAEVPQ